MSLVVFLRGVNVGGHKRFRPAALAKELVHLDAVNIGAAGTFVIRRRVSRAKLRDEVGRRLPFETEIMICDGRAIVELLSRDYFDGYPDQQDLVRFVSVVGGRPASRPPLPMSFPPSGAWDLRVLAIDAPFLVGIYRRQMKAIDYLGRLERVLGVPVTTRNWNTMSAIVQTLTMSSRA